MNRRDPYALIAPTYDWLIEPFLKPIKDLTDKILQSRLSPSRGLWVLDLACGTGSQARRLAQSGFKVLALEKSPGMIRQLRKKNRAGKGGDIIPIQGDLVDIPIASSRVDALVFQMALHEIIEAHRQRCLSEIKRVAKENAVLIFVDFAHPHTYTASYGLITLAEIAAGSRHYHNSRDFLKRGGLMRMIHLAGLNVKDTFSFFQGNICLVVASKKL